MTLAPPVPYFGGKQLVGPRIASLFPPHGHYVEPYAGSLAVLFSKPPSAMETVNDLDGDLVTFWRVLRDQPDDLERVCSMTPHSRAEFQASYDRDGVDDLERARRVWVTLTQGRGGVPTRTGWRHYVKPAGSVGVPGYLRGYVERMGPAVARLAHVSLECRPALEVIERYGREEGVLLYVDPPYLGDSRSTPDDPRRRTSRYRHEMLDEPEHRELAEALHQCKATVLLSGYPSALYDEDLYAGWSRVEFPTGTGQSARGEWSERTEVVWANVPLRRDGHLW